MNQYKDHPTLSRMNRRLAPFFEKAALAAIKHDERHFWLGCCAIRQDGAQVCSRNGPSHCKTPSTHAEAKVARKLGPGSIVYLVRLVFKNRGHKAKGPKEVDWTKWGNARPCSGCEALLRNKGVSKVYYTINSENYGTLSFERF